MKRVKPGSIMLFHNGAKNTPEALPKILDQLIADGYKLVPVSELIYHENYTIDHQGKQILAQTNGVQEKTIEIDKEKTEETSSKEKKDNKADEAE